MNYLWIRKMWIAFDNDDVVIMMNLLAYLPFLPPPRQTSRPIRCTKWRWIRWSKWSWHGWWIGPRKMSFSRWKMASARGTAGSLSVSRVAANFLEQIFAYFNARVNESTSILWVINHHCYSGRPHPFYKLDTFRGTSVMSRIFHVVSDCEGNSPGTVTIFYSMTRSIYLPQPCKRKRTAWILQWHHCLLTRLETNQTISSRFKDARSSDDGREIIIDRQQDCITIARSSEDEIAFRRKFDTCDENDFPFHEGTMFIYWMRGEEPLEFDNKFPTPDVPESDSGMTHLQLLRADSLNIPEKWETLKFLL